jgi:hypothetical protein
MPPTAVATSSAIKLYRVNPNAFTLRELSWMTGSPVLTAIGAVLKLFGVFKSGPDRYQLPAHWRDVRCEAAELSDLCRSKLEEPARELEQVGFRRIGTTRLLGHHPSMQDAGGLYLLHSSGRQFAFVLFGRSQVKVGEVTRTLEHLETGLASRTDDGVSHVTTGKKKRFPPSPKSRIRISRARSTLELVHDHEEWIHALSQEASFLRLASESDFEAAYDRAEDANFEYWRERGVYVPAAD